MSNQIDCFKAFSKDISDLSIPNRFTFPFYYHPHPLAVSAAEQLQHELEQGQYQHNFGLKTGDDKDAASGKMFGVLVVENKQKQLGFLAGFSGKLGDNTQVPGFVPPVFDMLNKDSFFKEELDIINKASSDYKLLENNPLRQQLAKLVNKERQAFDCALTTFKQDAAERKSSRKQLRNNGKTTLSDEQYEQLCVELSQQSVIDKLKLRDLKLYWQQRIEHAQSQHDELEQQLARLAKTRRKLSAKLQKKLFAQYQFLNIEGVQKDLNDIFADTAFKIPPAGAGDCAAPKLLQYAFNHQLKPVVMAEFWWGESPKSQVRRHKHYYPSCYSKCQPILGHMLVGMTLDDNPLLENPGKNKLLDILYEDNDMIVVNKPSGLLSVPGKTISDSVYTRIKQRYPNATGPLIVHRLDMSTSGLMVLALNAKANKALQRQFIARSVTKNYIADVDGIVTENEGEITLPLTLDINDRPRQMVCFETGKPAHTHFKVLERKGNITRLSLFPKTGRTHQLRVHCAHKLGLNMPIIGDEHYGNGADRLHLHAEYLQLKHPVSHEVMSFNAAPDF
ncbi:RluA family pseudouridine synthase [Thalassotalea maritima]|uniref:RluA family pseudouridine synthase n=1 Tax=Thalassotalea maritima TaxID=3242416 RepID=UPI003528FF85